MNDSQKIAKLLSALKCAGIRYCHWKSNEGLSRSLSGDNDLDLLVRKEDAGGFRAVMMQAGFKWTRNSGYRDMIGIEDYFGHDEDRATIIHVHAHYLLVVGHDASKSIVLPIADAYINSSQSDREGLPPVPCKKMELMVFCLRMVLKFTLTGALKGRSLADGSARREYIWLAEGANLESVLNMAGSQLPMISRALFSDCLVCTAGGKSTWVQLMTFWKLRMALQGCGRMGIIQEIAQRQYRRVGTIMRYILNARQSASARRLGAGGLIVAIVGGDGSGKSSANQHLADWLGRDFFVKKLHMGKPPRMILTYCLDVIYRTFGIRGRHLHDGTSENSAGYLQMLRSVLYARDRYFCYKQGYKAAVNGALVLYDRYYLPLLGRMDGAECAAAATAHPGIVRRWLAMREQAYLDKISKPDLLIHLAVSADLAVARKTTENPDYVRARNEEIMANKALHASAVVIDAALDQQIVWSKLRSVVWSRI